MMMSDSFGGFPLAVLPRVLSQTGEELFSPGGLLETAAGRRRGHPPRRSPTPHLHAEMAGFQHHHHSLRRQRPLEIISHLIGQSFLQLEPSGEMFDNSGNAAESHNSRSRHVSDVRPTVKREPVVDTEGIERNPADDDDLSGISRMIEVGQLRLDLIPIAAQHLDEKFCCPAGRLLQLGIAFRSEAEHLENLLKVVTDLDDFFLLRVFHDTR